MKIFTSLVLAAAVVSTAAVAEAAPIRQKALQSKFVMKTEKAAPAKSGVRKARRAASRAEENKVPLPLKENISAYIDGEWVDGGTYTYTYNPDGTIASEAEEYEGEISRIKYEYDKYGNTTLKAEDTSDDEGATWTPSGKTVKEFNDPIVHTFATANDIYRYYNDEWVIGSSNHFKVTRNADNNVTDYEIQVYFQGIYDPTSRVKLMYEDGASAPFEWYLSELEYTGTQLEWVDQLSFLNIEWNDCNGQFLTNNFTELFVGDNRVKSAEIWYLDEQIGTISATYDGDNFNSTIKEEGEGYTATVNHSLLYTDAYGSFTEKIESVSEEEGETYGQTESYEVEYDSHLNPISEISTMEMDGETYIEGTKWDYTYGDDGRVLETVISEYDMYEEEYVPTMKITAENFVDFSGIGNIVTDSQAECEWDGNTLTVKASGEVSVSVWSVSGISVAAAEGNGEFSLSLESLETGVYVARVATDYGVKTMKFVK